MRSLYIATQTFIRRYFVSLTILLALIGCILFIIIVNSNLFTTASISNATPDEVIGPDVGVGDELGSAVAMGDLNADGYADLVVGAEYADPNGLQSGQVDIYYGSASGISTASASVTLTGEAAPNYFGRSISADGDINGDGQVDLVISADSYNSSYGKVYIYYGGPSGISALVDDAVVGPDASSNFGSKISANGDFNNDGYDDLVVSGQTYNSYTGRVYLFYGSASGVASTADLVLTGAATGNVFGSQLTGAGDLNNDGYDDLVLGAPNISSSTGEVYVYYGSSIGISATPNITYTGENVGDSFGTEVDSEADINNDGIKDLFIGAEGYNADTGRVYIYYGNASGLGVTADMTLEGEDVDDAFGVQIASAGDINQDGYDDLLISGKYANNQNGRVYLYYGGASGPSSTPAIQYDPLQSFAEMGAFYSPLAHGDVDNDGKIDIAIGAPGAYNWNYDGTVYVYYNDITPTATPTPTSSPGNNIGGSSSSSPSTPSFTCTAIPPLGTPNLYQINVKGNIATLYFVPVGGQVTGYQIAYGYSPTDERFFVAFNQGYSPGAVSFSIGHLTPYSSFYFKVRAYNSCTPGNWGNTVGIKTFSSTNRLTRKYYKLTLPFVRR